MFKFGARSNKMKPPKNLNQPITKNTPNFFFFFFLCKCGGQYCDGFPADLSPLILLAELLQRERDITNYIFREIAGERDIIATHISSGYRCEEYNRQKRGSEKSYHVRLMAADIVPYFVAEGKNDNGWPNELVDTQVVANLAVLTGFRRVKRYSRHCHVDTGPGEWFDGFKMGF